MEKGVSVLITRLLSDMVPGGSVGLVIINLGCGCHMGQQKALAFWFTTCVQGQTDITR